MACDPRHVAIVPQDRLGFTINEVAKSLGISHSSVNKAVKTG